ncbi:MAG: 5'/3'-nucleotidase SurE [Thermodesulfobacteriota bacterium]|nr:5'/3'-nucleotidase SurE [Thermodesulfobacteriota bacterium]
MNILVTNDDGIESPGIKTLAEVLETLGDVITVAPEEEQSGISHAISMHRSLNIRRCSESKFAVDGTPSDCIALAVSVIMKKKPDLIASGINNGPNMAEDITYSGTVSAAVEGTLRGIPSFAVSLFARDNFNYNTAGLVSVRIASLILENGLPPHILLNVNVPNIEPSMLMSYKITRQGRRIYSNTVSENQNQKGEKHYLFRRDGLKFKDILDSDYNAVKNNHVSITPLHLDLTCYSSIKEISKWQF